MTIQYSSASYLDSYLYIHEDLHGFRGGEDRSCEVISQGMLVDDTSFLRQPPHRCCSCDEPAQGSWTASREQRDPESQQLILSDLTGDVFQARARSDLPAINSTRCDEQHLRDALVKHRQAHHYGSLGDRRCLSVVEKQSGSTWNVSEAAGEGTEGAMAPP